MKSGKRFNSKQFSGDIGTSIDLRVISRATADLSRIPKAVCMLVLSFFRVPVYKGSYKQHGHSIAAYLCLFM